MMKHEQKDGAALAAGDTDTTVVPADQLPHDDDIGACCGCGAALAMCVYWKINGYRACCPDCKHSPKVGSGTEAASDTEPRLNIRKGDAPVSDREDNDEDGSLW